MTSNIVAIVEYGAQKQQISLDVNRSYRDICDKVYARFKLDFTKSKYILQRQDILKAGPFSNVEERSFLNDLKNYATKNTKSPVVRLRLVPLAASNKLKPTNGLVNGEKAQSTSSQCQQDESDRASTTSVATIDVKLLIKKCLANLKETTENIQLLDRYLHPEDYIDDDCQSTNKSNSIQQSPSMVHTSMKRQISQTSFASDTRVTTSNAIEELLPVLNQMMNTEQSSSLSLVPLPNKPAEIVAELPQAPISHEVSMPVDSQVSASTPQTNGSSRSSNKSFSNRLGITLPSNHVQSTSHQELKSVATPIPHQYLLSSQAQSPINQELKVVTTPIVHQYLPPSQTKVIVTPVAHQYLPSVSPVNDSQSITNLSDRKRIEASPVKETQRPSKPKCRVELKQYEPGTTVDGIVSVASNASYFFLQIIDEQKDEFNHLAKTLHEYYSNRDKNSQYRPAIGDFCVAMYTEDARWYRARIIRYISDQTCEVFYIDYGNMEELPIDLLHEILPEFTRIPARAIACTIAEILPPNGQEGWTKRATFAFASRCSNESVQATVLESTHIKWPMHIVQLRVSKTQEDIGASLENCKVARRVQNKEICQFWSKKIRIEQYVLYNLHEPDPNRFPVIEQVPVNDENEELPNILLSSSLQPTSPNEDSVPEDIPTNNTDVVEDTVPQVKSPTNLNQEETQTTLNEQLSCDALIDPQDDRKESTSIELSSTLRPDAAPFVSEFTDEANQPISTGDESDDENDSNDTPVTSESSERPCMPIKKEVIVDTSLTPSTPLLKSWLPIEVTHIETPTRFYIRYIYGPSWNLGNGSRPELIEKKELPPKNVVLTELTQEMTECYTKHKRISPGDSYDEGELVASRYRARWHRGRFLEFKPNIDFAHIFFVDYGFTRSVPIQMIRPINNRFVLQAEQAHLVHLHQPGSRRGRIEWNANATDEFREMTKDGTNLYARTVQEPNTIELVSYDPLTKKWFSFYEHFVKHLNNCDNIDQKLE